MASIGLKAVATVLLVALVGADVIEGPPAGGVEIVVRPTDIDVKGHVNNAKYVEYLQWARWDWLDRKGLTNDRLAELRAVLVVVNIDIDYRREVRYGETLSTTVAVEKVGDKSVTLRQTVVKASGEVAAEATVVLVAVDPEARRSRPLPDELRKALREPEPNPDASP